MYKNSDKNRSLLICLALVLAVLAVFYQVRSFGFINLDDHDYVSKNSNIQAGITLNAAKWAFTTIHTGYWHALTWFSYMLDWQLFGLNAGGYHITNLIFHIANTLLLFIVLKRMTKVLWQSAFVAALFALHPLHVESVAWIAERKDVLSTFFWLLTMGAYVRYAKNPKLKWYLISLVLFALGLMAKPMLVTLPFVLLLLDYWPLNRVSRFNWKIIYRLILEKIPFIILAAVLSVVTFIAQQSSRAVASLNTIPVRFRICNASISYLEYIGKMFWPARLAFFYPYPVENVSILFTVTSAVLLIAATIFVLRFSKRHRYLFTGWFWYIGTLVPVIGIIQVGSQAMADRYTYISLTGLFIIIAWSLPELLGKLPYRKIVLVTSSFIVLSVFTVLSYFQLSYWKDNITLCRHALEVTKDNYMAHFVMTDMLFEQNRTEEALWHIYETVRINPDYVPAINSLGVALGRGGKIDEAIGYYKKAIEINPRFVETHLNLASALEAKGRFAEAVEQYRAALTIKDSPGIHGSLGKALLNMGMFRQAAAEYRIALSAMPDDPDILNGLGCALTNSGEFDEAVSSYNKALHKAPDSISIHLNLGFALTAGGKLDQAVKEYGKILLVEPNNAVAQNGLGIAFAKQGNLDNAVEHFSQAVKINPNYANAKNNLSAALAEKQKSQEKR
jgi:protein O-mannosyl-transferase